MGQNSKSVSWKWITVTEMSLFGTDVNGEVSLRNINLQF